jgi:CysZ protein
VFNFFRGLGFIAKGLRLIARPQVRRFVVIPLGINITLFATAIYLLLRNFEHWLETLMPDFPDWLSWLETALNWLLWPLFAVMILFLVFYTFTFVVNLVAAPFNGLLSEKIEALLQGHAPDTDSSLPSWDMVRRSIASEIGKLLYLLKWSCVLLVISLVPVINIAAPFLWLIFGAWMLALEYLDYPMGNHGRYFQEINQQAIASRTSSLGFGAGVLLLTSIPIINFLAMPAGVAGATALWVEQERRKIERA